MNNQNLDLKSAWITIKEAFPILESPSKIPDNDFDSAPFEAISIIKRLNLTQQIQDLVIIKIEERLRKEIVPDFWSHFKKTENEAAVFHEFYSVVKFLFHNYVQLDLIINKLILLREASNFTKPVYNQTCLHEALKLIVRAVLLSQLPIDHEWMIVNFYETALKMQDPEEENSTSGECVVCMQEEFSCSCREMFEETNKKLGKMTLLEPLVGQALTDLIYSYIQTHIQKICKDNFDNSHIESLEKWLQTVVISWLKKIYFHNSAVKAMDEFDKKLINYLYNTYTKIRIDQLFNIIIEYPDSLPALDDLRLCLPKTDLKPHLTRSLQKAIETRLLHPGVSTFDVLTAYVATIRSLRILDPCGLLLETITQPVHQYLRSREDTIRCVVGSLTEEGPNDLAEELVRGEAVQVDENISVDEGVEDWETWTPDPVDVVPSKSSGLPRTSDIISMLVNVYGSKELFVNEYRTLLADRLLSQYSCDTEKEIRYLELLKLRFGDSQLHFCEVMLKDIADSKRINQHIQQDLSYSDDDIPMSAMILSAQFWPAFKDEKLELHEKLVKQMESYTGAFETLKGSRTLCWKNHLGIVDLEIELADRTLNLSVSPVHATILMHFQDQNTWSLEALSKVMHVPSTILRRKLSFWQSHGIITEPEPDVFYLQEEQENNENNIQDDIVVEDFESESAMASAQDQREEELQTFWSYILGMLMNLDTLPLERIHQMLKMFAFQGPTIECNLQELKVFLDRKVREHQLIYSNGLYRLPK
ncbi:anaphase-promoting complex subunit 2 [Tribolium castaneum]|uniref:Anaphase-promoting complex subunit 2 n=1 Tax=Tribolium castaneum TaxID=7070 RepID=D6WHQ9_TRICA|nr:PREDICTED: anaphase-promoting complex subunit 2 [Tribolium castaneum]EFA00073.1 Anaphase-promoting complex subunit 2-like Protein [Tribolium castaneum]|eukprot:XP_008191039.1 PREDICTED: anaphase-promoting complex subunit 2 [Tribolium castaneum]